MFKAKKVMKVTSRSFCLDPESNEMLKTISEKFGCNHSEVIRSVLRFYWDRNKAKLEG